MICSALLASLLLPASVGASADVRPPVDPEGVVRDSKTLLERARTVQGSYTAVNGDGASRVQFVLEKSQFLSLRSTTRIDVFNGAEHVALDPRTRRYESRAPEVYGTPYVIGFTDFLLDAPERKLARPVFSAPTVVTVGGREYVRRATGTADAPITYDIDPATKLPVRWSWRRGATTYTAVFEEIQLDAPVPDGVFDVAALKVDRERVPTVEEAALPSVGSTAPGIEGIGANRRRFALGEYLSTRRATVLAFVDGRSLSSSNGLVSLGDLVRGSTLRDVGVVAVVRSSNEDEARALACKFGTEPPALYGATGRDAIAAYRVGAFPTFVVLDRSGMVMASVVGFDRAALLTALRPAN